MIYYAVLIIGAITTSLVWRVAHQRCAPLPRRLRWIARGLFAGFFIAVLSYLLIPLTRPYVETEPYFPPVVWATLAYVWFPFVLQFVLLSVVLSWLVRSLRARLVAVRRPSADPGTPTSSSAPAPASTGVPTGTSAFPGSAYSRRDALALMASAAGPVAALGCTVIARQQSGQFSVRRADVVVPSLPADLDGVTIAHITDLHAGQFFDADACARLADAVNALRADLVVFTGDLIDRGIITRIPIGLRFLNGLDRRHGFAMIEGNHDLHEHAEVFEQTMRDAGMPILLDGETTFNLPGRRTPVQMLGVTWGPLKYGSDVDLSAIDPADPPVMERNWTLEWAKATVTAVSALRKPEAFPILLAHHPHTILPAADAKLPLVLAGHTHGGQIMLTDTLGAGPIRFKYWTGQHDVGGSKLVICNGVGGWFPLRINAPPEVLHLTLRRPA